eukprot:8870262-Pyramimonas_sp.AAC.1
MPAAHAALLVWRRPARRPALAAAEARARRAALAPKLMTERPVQGQPSALETAAVKPGIEE